MEVGPGQSVCLINGRMRSVFLIFLFFLFGAADGRKNIDLLSSKNTHRQRRLIHFHESVHSNIGNLLGYSGFVVEMIK